MKKEKMEMVLNRIELHLLLARQYLLEEQYGLVRNELLNMRCVCYEGIKSIDKGT